MTEGMPAHSGGGRYLCEGPDGRLFYINHANAWQECPNFIAETRRRAARYEIALDSIRRARTLNATTGFPMGIYPDPARFMEDVAARALDDTGPAYVFPNHAIVPTKAAVFDDREFRVLGLSWVGAKLRHLVERFL